MEKQLYRTGLRPLSSTSWADDKGVVGPQTPTHVCRDLSLTVFFQTVHHRPCPGYVKQYTSQPSVHCLYRLYYQQCSHFLYIKEKKKPLKKNLLFIDDLSTFQKKVQNKRRQISHERERISRIQVTVQKCGPGGSTWSMHVFMLPCSPLKPSCEDILYKKATWLFLHY